MPATDTPAELLELTRKLLTAIDMQDWTTYAELCDPSLTAFEPEAVGQLVSGMDFHRFYFRSRPNEWSKHSTIASPHVRLLGDDAAVVTYVRLTQRRDEMGQYSTTAAEETRVWQRIDGVWKHIHFHRSPCGSA